MEGEKKLAVPYIRFSSGAQKKGDSERRQNEMLGRWAEQNTDYELSGLRFEDLGRSGFDREHLEHGFGQLLAAIEAGHIPTGSVVLVEAMDRVGRLEPMEMLPLISKIVSAGVSIITLDDGAKYDLEAANKHLLFMLVAKIQAAWQYSDTLSRRLSASWEGKRQKAMKGEQVKRYTPMWLTTENELDPVIAPLARQAFEDFADGLGGRRIIRRLREQNGAFDAITPAGLMLWMENRTAIGYWNDIPDQHPPLIGMELWHRVQQERNRRGKKRLAAPSKYFLSGLVKCSVCGSNFKSYGKKGSAVLLRCFKREKYGEEGCSNSKTLPEPVVEWVRKKTYRTWLSHISRQRKLSESSLRVIEIDKELEQIGKAIGRLLEIDLDIPELKDKLTGLQGDRERLQAEKLALEQVGNKEMTFSDFLNATEELDRDAEELEADKLKLNALLQTVGYEIVVIPEVEGIKLAVGEKSFIYTGAVRTKPNGSYVTTYSVLEGKTTHRLVNDGSGTLAERSFIKVSKAIAAVTLKDVMPSLKESVAALTGKKGTAKK